MPEKAVKVQSLKAVTAVKITDVSFEYYFNSFNGGNPGRLNNENFEKYVCRAKREVKCFFSTESIPANVREDVMLCICEIAELLFETEKKGGIKSESLDGYSVTYPEKAETADEIRKTVVKRLGWTGLLFAGVE